MIGEFVDLKEPGYTECTRLDVVDVGRLDRDARTGWRGPISVLVGVNHEVPFQPAVSQIVLQPCIGFRNEKPFVFFG